MEARILAKDKAKRVRREEKKDIEKKLTAVDIAESIKRGLAEVKLIEEGKLKATTLKDFLNGL
jgi:hypothetical protein